MLILDIGLPKKNGILVGEELIESLPDRPLVIALTGYGYATTRALAEEAGFDHFLVKPADPFHIESLIEDHLKRRSGDDGPPVSRPAIPVTDQAPDFSPRFALIAARKSSSGTSVANELTLTRPPGTRETRP